MNTICDKGIEMGKTLWSICLFLYDFLADTTVFSFFRREEMWDVQEKELSMCRRQIWWFQRNVKIFAVLVHHNYQFFFVKGRQIYQNLRLNCLYLSNLLFQFSYYLFKKEMLVFNNEAGISSVLEGYLFWRKETILFNFEFCN